MNKSTSSTEPQGDMIIDIERVESPSLPDADTAPVIPDQKISPSLVEEEQRKGSNSTDEDHPRIQTRPPKAANLSFLDQAIEGCMSNAVGLLGIAVWKFDQSSGNLVPVRPLQVFRSPQEVDPKGTHANPGSAKAYERLVQEKQSKLGERFIDCLHMSPTSPGVGLPGILWSESAGNSGGNHANGENIVWRKLDDIANDPHQPHDECLHALAEAGFALAGAVPFDIRGYRGMVAYLANQHIEPSKLRHPTNIRFLQNAALLIGAAAATERSFEEGAAYKAELREKNWRRLRIKILSIVWFGGSLREEKRSSLTPATTNYCSVDDKGGNRKCLRKRNSVVWSNFKGSVAKQSDMMKGKGKRWFKKIRGGDGGIPPSFNKTQTCWTFIGVFSTHVILSRLNVLIKSESEGQLELILAPIGAFSGLQYALMAAPASQPRNAFFGSCFALTTAILISYIPNVAPWFRMVLAPSIVIPGMAKLGIIHPPAGAASIIFSSGQFRWTHMGIYMAGICITIINGVIINNLSDMRQYPTSWPLINRVKTKMLPKHAEN